MGFIRLLFSFDGRIGRAHFWVGVIFLSLLGSIVDSGLEQYAVNLNSMQKITVLILTSLSYFWMYFALLVKRLHDRGMSGRWLWLHGVLPIVFGILALFAHGTAFGSMALAVGAAIALWVLVDLGLIQGDAEENKFGPSPRNSANMA